MRWSLHALTRLYTHAYAHTLTRSLSHLPAHALSHIHTHSLTHSLTYPPTDQLVQISAKAPTLANAHLGLLVTITIALILARTPRAATDTHSKLSLTIDLTSHLPPSTHPPHLAPLTHHPLSVATATSLIPRV